MLDVIIDSNLKLNNIFRELDLSKGRVKTTQTNSLSRSEFPSSSSNSVTLKELLRVADCVSNVDDGFSACTVCLLWEQIGHGVWRETGNLCIPITHHQCWNSSFGICMSLGNWWIVLWTELVLKNNTKQNKKKYPLC